MSESFQEISDSYKSTLDNEINIHSQTQTYDLGVGGVLTIQQDAVGRRAAAWSSETLMRRWMFTGARENPTCAGISAANAAPTSELMLY